MTGFRDMDKKHQKCPKNGGFPNFIQKTRKSNERSLRYQDGHTNGRTHGRTTEVITKDPFL